MKSNKEFLEGVYRKASTLEEEKNIKNAIYKRYIKFSSVAAIIVILPLLFFINQISGSYTEIPQMVRMINIKDPVSNFLEADYIIVGRTKEVHKSQYVKEENYIYTDVIIDIDKVFLGDISQDEIRLRVKGGKVKKEKLYSKMEGNFKKGSRILLFLYKENDIYYLVNGSESQFEETERDIFVDKSGNKYDLNKIKENMERR